MAFGTDESVLLMVVFIVCVCPDLNLGQAAPGEWDINWGCPDSGPTPRVSD